jgi:hypothetical protein
VSSLFIYGAEEVVRGYSMVFTCHFAHDLDLERVRSSYDALVRNRSELQVKWQCQQATKSYEWVPFSAAELTTLLAREQTSLSCFHTFDEVVADYSPTNERPLVRLSLLDTKTVAFEVNHTLTNADGGLYWMQEWLRFYERKPGEGAPEPTVLPVPSSMVAKACAEPDRYVLAFCLRIQLLAAGGQAFRLRNGGPDSPSPSGRAAQGVCLQNPCVLYRSRATTRAASSSSSFATSLCTSKPRRASSGRGVGFPTP